MKNLARTIIIEAWHEISNNVVCATSKGSDQPAHTRSLIRAFASRLNNLWLLNYCPNSIWSYQEAAQARLSLFMSKCHIVGNHMSRLNYYTSKSLPKATAQQSLFVSPSPGSIVATGSFFCLGSHTFTLPNKKWRHNYRHINYPGQSMKNGILCANEYTFSLYKCKSTNGQTWNIFPDFNFQGSQLTAKIGPRGNSPFYRIWAAMWENLSSGSY